MLVINNGRCLHILVKRNEHHPNFFISPPISLNDLALFHVFVHIFLWDPPLLIEDGYDPPDDRSRPVPPSEAPPPPTHDDRSTGFVSIHQRIEHRPPKISPLQITHSMETIGPILVSSFDDAPSRATVMHGMLGSNPIVIKLAAQDRDEAIMAEGAIYRERLQGIEGVPKFYAEGWLFSNAHWVSCLVLQDLDIPLIKEGLESKEDLDPVSSHDLEDLVARLNERGVIHDDLGPRNIVRTYSGGIGLVDFEGAMLVPRQVTQETEQTLKFDG
ncbi:hypothetical protein C8R46DRAFT_1124386 [Mycena filopes]|nr:hypothetical protein C8R46DRAFT_1124386 [Mycena filopes]